MTELAHWDCWGSCGMPEKFTASGGHSELIGTDVKALKEKGGSPIGEKLLKAVKEGKISMVSYNFPRPGETKPVPKATYVTQVGNQGCGVGYYK